jgi:hypothetical protein
LIVCFIVCGKSRHQAVSSEQSQTDQGQAKTKKGVHVLHFIVLKNIAAVRIRIVQPILECGKRKIETE